MSENQTTEAPKKQKQTVPLAVFIVVTVIAFGFGYMYAGQQTPEPSPTVTVTVAPEAEEAPSQAPAQAPSENFSDGVFVVGTQFPAGTYTSSGPVESYMCMYNWKTGLGQDADTVNFSSTNGSATIQLNDGEIFESKNCGTWSKVG